MGTQTAGLRFGSVIGLVGLGGAELGGAAVGEGICIASVVCGGAEVVGAVAIAAGVSGYEIYQNRDAIAAAVGSVLQAKSHDQKASERDI